METIGKAIQYALDPTNNFVGAVGVHLQLSFLALLIGALVAIPLGIAISRNKALSQVVVNMAGIIRVVPSLAVLFLLIPILHTGFAPSLAALTILAIPPLLINTEAGMSGVSPAIVDAGRGMGMTTWGLLMRVQLPLALPVMLAAQKCCVLACRRGVAAHHGGGQVAGQQQRCHLVQQLHRGVPLGVQGCGHAGPRAVGQRLQTGET